MMNKQQLRKCLYCDYRSSDREEQKKHSREKHHAKMVEIARKNNQTIEWTIGMAASYFTSGESVIGKRSRDG
jgi:2-iminoacetate synthase ThiH